MTLAWSAFRRARSESLSNGRCLTHSHAVEVATPNSSAMSFTDQPSPRNSIARRRNSSLAVGRRVHSGAGTPRSHWVSVCLVTPSRAWIAAIVSPLFDPQSTSLSSSHGLTLVHLYDNLSGVNPVKPTVA